MEPTDVKKIYKPKKTIKSNLNQKKMTKYIKNCKNCKNIKTIKLKTLAKPVISKPPFENNVKIRTNIEYYNKVVNNENNLDVSSKKEILSDLGIAKSANIPSKLVNDLYFLLHQ